MGGSESKVIVKSINGTQIVGDLSEGHRQLDSFIHYFEKPDLFGNKLILTADVELELRTNEGDDGRITWKIPSGFKCDGATKWPDRYFGMKPAQWLLHDFLYTTHGEPTHPVTRRVADQALGEGFEELAGALASEAWKNSYENQDQRLPKFNFFFHV